MATQEFDDEFFEWEERKDDTPFTTHMVSGSIAGIVEHCSLLPLDTIKTHRQSLMLKLSVAKTVKYIASQPGGMFNFWRGSTIMALGCVPAHAIFFSIYEVSRKWLKLDADENVNFHLNTLVGVLSTAFHDMIMTPCEGNGLG
jgi:solute carrier family 25 iron transporter 28/37